MSSNILKESEEKYGPFFKGFNPVAADKVANAYLKSAAGAQTGQVYRVY